MQFVLRTIQLVFGFVQNVAAFLTGVAGRSLRNPWLFHALHYAFVILTTAALAYFSPKLMDEMGRLPGDDLHPLVRKYYLAVVFLLSYASLRVLVIVVRLFLVRNVAEFADIEEAWRDGIAKLESHGIDVSWCPLYLVLGLSRSEEKSFFEASRLAWTGIAPENPAAPLRFYFGNEIVFVALPGVGCVSEHASGPLPIGDDPDDRRRGDSVGESVAPELARTVTADMLRAARSGDRAAVASPADTWQPQAAGGRTMDAVRTIGGTIGGTMVGLFRRAAPAAAPGGGGAVAGRIVPLSPSVVERQRRRLEFLCELIQEDRSETGVFHGRVCPLNGVAVGMPLEWSASSSGINAAESVSRDLTTLHEALGLSYPVVVAETGLERLVGLEEFVERGVAEQDRFRDRRLGSGLPDGNPFAEQERKWLVDRALHGSMLSVVYTALAADVGHQANRKLYHLLCSLLDRRDRLLQQLEHAIGELGERGVRFAGMYFCAAGDAPRRKAFVRGILDRLNETQAQVAWTGDRIAKNRWLVWAATALFVVAVAGLAADGWYAWRLFGEK